MDERLGDVTVFQAQMMVAKDFVNVMRDQGFKTFAEMRKSFCWNTKDVKREIDDILWTLTSDLYVDELDGTMVLSLSYGGGVYYRDFVRGVYSLVRYLMSR